MHGLSKALPPAARLALAVIVLAAVAVRADASSSGPPRLQSIRVDPATISLIPGRTATVRAVGTYTDGSTRDLTGVTFKTRDAKVATVDATGLVTAVSDGRCEIGAVDPQTGVSSRTNAKVTVWELDSIAIVPAKLALRAGAEATLQAIGTYADGTTGVDLTNKLVWTSAKNSIATPFTQQDGGVGVRAVATGTTTIIARDPDTGIKSSNQTGIVTVVGRLLQVTVSPARKTIRVGERSRLKATGTFEKGVTADITADVDWSTGDAAIATIEPDGRVRGVAIGNTTARATDRATHISSTASAGDSAIQVVGDVIALRVSPSYVILPIGGKAPLKASAFFAETPGTVNFTTKVDWTSSDPTRVTVDRLGSATCISPGTVTASASDPETGVTSTATAGDARVICGLELTGIQVVPDAVTLGPTKTKKVKAFFVFEDGTQVDVTKQVEWTSSDRRIATVDVADPNIGRVTGIGDGIATIVARDRATGRSSDDRGGKSCTVTVQGQPVSIKVEPDPGTGVIHANLGETLKLKILARFVGGSTRGMDAFVTWQSSNPAIVSVSNGDDGERPGTAHFLARGTVTITATYPKIGTPPPPGATNLQDTIDIVVE
ncbi:MAG TPA: Ig-like domain-containing protein [Candidatus Binatia bacterium]|nr:Ig-like domain-containing protein [Candidatus Binatia bacterium]